jgi:hypothetical protein
VIAPFFGTIACVNAGCAIWAHRNHDPIEAIYYLAFAVFFQLVAILYQHGIGGEWPKRSAGAS